MKIAGMNKTLIFAVLVWLAGWILRNEYGLYGYSQVLRWSAVVVALVTILIQICNKTGISGRLRNKK